MQYRDIIARIMASPEGGTVSRTEREEPTYGFFVGGHGQPIVFSAGSEFTPDLERQIIDWLRKCSAPFVGWWTDGETGKLYLDGSDWIEAQFTAAQVARLRKEIAFWDIGNDRELRVAYVEGEV
jgi:hypothetical protein